jgi:N6-adenosine-specific RNA methylase IME4
MKSTDLTTRQNVGVMQVEEARAIIAKCVRVDEVKKIRDQAQALKAYVRQQGASRNLYNDAAEIKLRAERRIGELIADRDKAKGAATPRGGPRARGGIVQPRAPETLKELGIERTAAKRWQDIARIPEKEFDTFIEETKKDGEITTAGALSIVKKQSRQSNAENKRVVTLDEAVQGRFPVIYADPPWQYTNTGFSGSAESQDPTMSTDDICAMPVADKSTTNSVLLMWATWPLLKDALRVIEAWGFDYKTGAPWKKNVHVGGFYFLGITEPLLVAVRGSALPRETPIGFFDYPRTKHSRKPVEIYELIERMYEGPYLEMFARTERAGWTSFGNEPALKSA